MDHHNSQCPPRQCPYCRAHLSPQKLHQCQHVEKRISSTSATRTLQQLLLTPTWDPSLIKAFQKLEREKEKEVQLSKRRRPLPSSFLSAASPSPSSSASSISPLPFSPSLSSASTAKSSLQCPYCGEPCVPNLMHYCMHIEPLVTPRSNQPTPETVIANFNRKQTYIKSVKKAAGKPPTTTARNNCPALSASADDGETNDSLTIPPFPKQCPYCLEHFSQEEMHQCKHFEVKAIRKRLTQAMLPNEGANMSKNNNNDNKTATTYEACQKRRADLEGGQLLDQYLKPRPANIARAGARRSPPNGSKLYRCDFCTKSDFVDFAHYMGHRLVHISERPHQCDQCSSAFARRSTLIRHIKESHSSSFSSLNSHSPATFSAQLQTPNQCQQQQEQQQQQQQQQSESEFETEAELDPGISSGPEPYLELRIKQESDTEPETELTATEPKELNPLKQAQAQLPILLNRNDQNSAPQNTTAANDDYYVDTVNQQVIRNHHHHHHHQVFAEHDQRALRTEALDHKAQTAPRDVRNTEPREPRRPQPQITTVDYANFVNEQLRIPHQMLADLDRPVAGTSAILRHGGSGSAAA
ncbi:PREDICTED: zinc finger protein 271-like, partial [Rhagoletis zephyria]|uniref:zinc finger protein 271-like n=1 Tax=Rhagoletis zephyria TaxID=28612 RepID=UPI000811A619